MISKGTEGSNGGSRNRSKLSPRPAGVQSAGPLNLLAQGPSDKKIRGQLNISPRTVKQHLRTLFLRAGIGRMPKRVKLAIAIFDKGGIES